MFELALRLRFDGMQTAEDFRDLGNGPERFRTGFFFAVAGAAVFGLTADIRIDFPRGSPSLIGHGRREA